MPRVQRSALLPIPAAQMFELVNDIERYPEFLPWCAHAEVVGRDDTSTTATLTVKRGRMERAFTTRNVRQYPQRIEMQLVDGPFETLSGGWQFADIGCGGGEDESDVAVVARGCKVTLDLQFEFSRRILSSVFQSLFSAATNSLVDAFCERAGELYRP